MPKTREELDTALDAAPDAINKAAVDTLTPVLQPIIDKMGGSPDYAKEVDTLTALPAKIGAALAKSVSDLFNPPQVAA